MVNIILRSFSTFLSHRRAKGTWKLGVTVCGVQGHFASFGGIGVYLVHSSKNTILKRNLFVCLFYKHSFYKFSHIKVKI